MIDAPPFILTLALDRPTFAIMDRWRKLYFPPERNFLPAHLTFFHALPAERETDVRETLRAESGRVNVLPLVFSRLRFLGKGVAVEVESAELIALRKRLAAAWGGWLGAQDRQSFRPHVTIQNKVAPAKARQLYDSLAGGWREIIGRGEGLLLWRYLGGPWELVEEYKFAGREFC